MSTINIGLRCLGASILAVLYQAVVVALIANAIVGGGLPEEETATVQLAASGDVSPRGHGRHGAPCRLGSALQGPACARGLALAQAAVPFSVPSSRSNGLRAPPFI